MLASETAASSPIFSLTSLLSLLLVLYLIIAAYTLSTLVFARTQAKSRFIFSWLVFDALLHFIMEGAFVWTSTFGRTANSGTRWPALLWQEYAKADARWGEADATIVSLELLTVFVAGPIAAYIAYLMAAAPSHALTREDRQFNKIHFWTIVLSTMELYGGGMTFFPEWLTGSTQLSTDNFLHCWVYLALMNGIWVAIPAWLLWDSYSSLTSTAATHCKSH